MATDQAVVAPRKNLAVELVKEVERKNSVADMVPPSLPPKQKQEQETKKQEFVPDPDI